MLKIRAMVVDDEPLARERIVRLLKKDPQVEIAGQCGDAREAEACIRSKNPDLLFLDVQMPRVDGFQLLLRLEQNVMPAVIFVTAYNEYALKAFEVHAIDYLLKPFKRTRFEEALNRFKEQFETNSSARLVRKTLAFLESWNRGSSYLNRLVIPKDNHSVLVKVEDIDWFQAEDNYVRVHIAGESHLLRESLSHLEKQLDPFRFVRVHRNAIVNLDRVQQIQPWFRRTNRIQMRGGSVIPMSRRFRSHFANALKPVISRD